MKAATTALEIDLPTRTHLLVWLFTLICTTSPVLAQGNPRLTSEAGQLRLTLELPPQSNITPSSGIFPGVYTLELPFAAPELARLAWPAEITARYSGRQLTLEAPAGRSYGYQLARQTAPDRLVLDLYYRPEKVEEVAPGFRLREWWAYTPQPLQLTVLEADPLVWELRPEGLPGQRQTVAQLAPTAVAALNGGYFDLATGTPVGLWVRQGQALHLPFGRTALLWENNTLLALKPQLKAIVRSARGSLNVGLNRNPARYTAYTLPGTAGRPGEWLAVVQNGVISEVQPAPFTLPQGLWGLAFPAGENYRVGDALMLETNLLPSFPNALEAGPLLVQSGRYAFDPQSEPFNDPRPLTATTQQAAVAWTQTGQLWLVATQPTTPATLARILLQRGAWGALRMDSGGSTQLAVQGQLRFSALQPPRAVVSALAVYARPLPQPPTEPIPLPLVEPLEPASASPASHGEP